MKKCDSCNAAIIWAYTAAGKRMPLDAAVSEHGTIMLDGKGVASVVDLFNKAAGDRYVSHFATCPNASKHRKARS